MSDIDKAALAAATEDVASAMIKAAGKALEARGSDPQDRAVLTAAFAHAIRRITDEIDPIFADAVIHVVLKQMESRSTPSP